MKVGSPSLTDNIIIPNKIDACIGFCLNDGECALNPVGVAVCTCKDHFIGERCETRFEPKTQQIAYIAGGIGGAVAILILIVVIVWMICFRFSKKVAVNDDEKVAVDGSSDRAGSRLEDNFM